MRNTKAITEETGVIALCAAEKSWLRKQIGQKIFGAKTIRSAPF
jgi:hypothetical protein